MHSEHLAARVDELIALEEEGWPGPMLILQLEQRFHKSFYGEVGRPAIVATGLNGDECAILHGSLNGVCPDTPKAMHEQLYPPFQRASRPKKPEWRCTTCSTPNFMDRARCRRCGGQARKDAVNMHLGHIAPQDKKRNAVDAANAVEVLKNKFAQQMGVQRSRLRLVFPSYLISTHGQQDIELHNWLGPSRDKYHWRRPCPWL